MLLTGVVCSDIRIRLKCNPEDDLTGKKVIHLYHQIVIRFINTNNDRLTIFNPFGT